MRRVVAIAVLLLFLLLAAFLAFCTGDPEGLPSKPSDAARDDGFAAPGIVAGLVLGFARSLGEFGATITLAGSIAGETRTLPIAIYQNTQVPGGDAAALRMTLASVALSVLALAASELVLRRLRARAASAAGRDA